MEGLAVCVRTGFIAQVEDRLARAVQVIGAHIILGLRGPADKSGTEASPGICFRQLAPERFAAFRRGLGLSEAAYLESMSELTGGSTQQSGKSGSLFWFSGDRRFVVKSTTLRELDKLLDMLPRYIAHVQAGESAKRPCLLCRFYGAYTITVGQQVLRLLAMDNVFADQMPQRIYDLKGTTEDRFVKPKVGRVMKDLNFQDSRLRLDGEQASLALSAILRDTLFLQGEGIMDYSLLLGAFGEVPVPWADPVRGRFSGIESLENELEDQHHPANVLIRIIDVLVDWSFWKKVAYAMKKPTLGCCYEIDTEPPDRYQARFFEYMEAKLVAGEPCS